MRKMNSSDLGLSSKLPIFVDEHLTGEIKTVLNEAKRLKKVGRLNPPGVAMVKC